MITSPTLATLGRPRKHLSDWPGLASTTRDDADAVWPDDRENWRGFDQPASISAELSPIWTNLARIMCKHHAVKCVRPFGVAERGPIVVLVRMARASS